MIFVFVRNDKIKDSIVSTLEIYQHEAVHLMPTLALPVLLLHILHPLSTYPLSFSFVPPFSVTLHKTAHTIMPLAFPFVPLALLFKSSKY